jgi:hypothetical protein
MLKVFEVPINALVPVFGQLAPEGVELEEFVHRSVVTTQENVPEPRSWRKQVEPWKGVF